MLVGVFDDITARKRAEEEHEKLASLAENGTDFIGIASMDGQATFMNRAGRGVVGLGGDDDLAQLTIDDFLAESERNRMQDTILPQLWRDGHWEGEVLFRNFRTGGAISMWQHIFFVTNSCGGRIAIGTVSRDLTDRKESEARIQAAQSQLAHMARVITMGEMAAAIAHDVNQPLAAVVSNANACKRWLSGATPDLGEARAAASRIAEEGTRASEVVSRIRTLMKKRPANVERLRLNDVVEQVVDLVRSQILRHGISLRLELLPDLPLIKGDPIQLQQVVLNLIANAIEATAERPDREREIVLLTERLAPAEASMSVRDSGAGIDPTEMEQIFKPFYTTKSSGMGMGLAISRTIIEAHRGRLWATRNQGAGSTFRFSIPATAAV
jgi:PAS domain S-box-containing protein